MYQKLEENQIQLNSGNLLQPYKVNGNNSNSEVGFIINKAVKEHVLIVKRVSDRIGYLVLKMKGTWLKHGSIWETCTSNQKLQCQGR